MYCSQCYKVLEVPYVLGGQDYCEDCGEIAARSLMVEPINVMPEEFDEEAFKRFALKYALQFLSHSRHLVEAVHPALGIPDVCASMIERGVLDSIMPEWADLIRRREDVDGGLQVVKYVFARPLPKIAVTQAYLAAGLITEEEGEPTDPEDPPWDPGEPW